MIGEQLKSQQIDYLQASYWNAFESWFHTTKAYQTLAIPEQFGNVFIPQRILELSEDPSNVQALLLSNEPTHLHVIIRERFRNPISDPEKFAEWRQAHPKGLEVIKNRFTNTDAPEGIDYAHIHNLSLVDAGVLELTDKLFWDYMANVHDGYPSIVETRMMHDRPELHGQGIGGSFYQRLESILKTLNFQYLAGQVISPHAGFFSKSRNAFKDLSSEIQAKLPTHYGRSVTTEQESRWMIRIL